MTETAKKRTIETFTPRQFLNTARDKKDLAQLEAIQQCACGRSYKCLGSHMDAEVVILSPPVGSHRTDGDEIIFVLRNHLKPEDEYRALPVDFNLVREIVAREVESAAVA